MYKEVTGNDFKIASLCEPLRQASGEVNSVNKFILVFSPLEL